MKPSAEPVPHAQWAVDTRRFCERQGRLAAAFGPADLPRLAAEAARRIAPVAVTVEATMSPRGLPGLRLRLDGAITLTCQRCLRPVTLALQREALFELVDSPAALDADDDETWDRLAHAERLDLVHVAEDEMLLALPYSPRHDACEPAGRLDAGEKVSPFAGLAALKEPGRR